MFSRIARMRTHNRKVSVLPGSCWVLPGLATLSWLHSHLLAPACMQLSAQRQPVRSLRAAPTPALPLSSVVLPCQEERQIQRRILTQMPYKVEPDMSGEASLNGLSRQGRTGLPVGSSSNLTR